MYKRRLFAVLASAAFLGSVFFWTSTPPVNSLGQLNMTADATGFLNLSSGENNTATYAGGNSAAVDAVIDTPGVDTPTNPESYFEANLSVADLAAGDGTPIVTNFTMRARGNTACHIASSVSSYTATDLSVIRAGVATPLAGNDGTELDFMTIGNGAMTAGTDGDDSGGSYGSMWAGSNTLADLNAGDIATVSDGLDPLASFTTAPSLAGGMTSPDNWVQCVSTFSMPTGAFWQSTATFGTAGTITLAVQFEIYSAP